MSDLNVARLVPHNEQDALLAAACPLPDMVAGVGHVFHRGEYWLLIYESCGHDQYFGRTADGLYDCVGRAKPNGHFGPSRTPISEEAEHRFRLMPNRDFG